MNLSKALRVLTVIGSTVLAASAQKNVQAIVRQPRSFLPTLVVLFLFLYRASAVGTSSGETKASAAAPKAGHWRTVPRKSNVKLYRKHEASEINAGVSASPIDSVPDILVFVAKTKSGEMVMYLEKADNSAPFVYSTIGYMKRHMAFTRNHLNIHHVMERADPNDPRKYRTQFIRSSNRTRDRRWAVLVHVFPRGKKSANTATNRRRWAETFVSFFNHPNNQSRYTHPLEARFVGDVTPQDSINAPELSTYLTIRDTMLVLREVLYDTEDTVLQEYHNYDGKATIRTCLADDVAMRNYYKPEHLEPARAYYATYDSTPRGSNS